MARTAPASDEDRVKSFESSETNDGEDVEEASTQEETSENDVSGNEDDSDSGNDNAPDSGEGDAATGDDSDEEESEDDKKKAEEKPKQPKKKTVKQRVNELTREKYDAIRRAEAAEARAAELERQTKNPPVGTAEAESVDTAETFQKPDPNDFPLGEIDIGYIEAVSEWKADQKIAAFKRELEENRQTEAAERRAQELRTKASEIEARGFEKYDDFAEKVIAMKVEFSPEIAETFLESDVAEDIIYTLASDPKEAARIAALSPARQGVEFARLEARLKASTEVVPEEQAETEQKPQRQQKPPKAPAPPKTLTRGAGGQFAAKADTDDFASLQEAWRQGKVR
ncbi:MAG: hypothetical protein HC888_04650 [Candidatus Competibacteraceae bacterium]|nr:hypothetical protein [Candidatus Competibacteraceae bacterium]